MIWGINKNFSGIMLHPLKSSSTKKGQALAFCISFFSGLLTLGSIHAVLGIKQAIKHRKEATPLDERVSTSASGVLSGSKNDDPMASQPTQTSVKLELVAANDGPKFKTSSTQTTQSEKPNYKVFEDLGSNSPPGSYKLSPFFGSKTNFILEIAGVQEKIMVRRSSRYPDKYYVVDLNLNKESKTYLTLPQIISMNLWSSYLPEGWKVSSMEFGFSAGIFN